ncbi:MAG: hypothetical protein OSA99_19615 [Acidimicrobiales bacterium]|nr:hypothetical protein [Acidimicrobiales bacterium]
MKTRSRPTVLLGGAVVIIAFSWVGLALMGGGDVERARASGVLAGMCETLEVSSNGGDAQRPFYDEAHEDLHTLAADVTELDRAVAARLLRAKERVESALSAEFPDEQLTAMIQTLVDATQEAARVIDPSTEAGCS